MESSGEAAAATARGAPPRMPNGAPGASDRNALDAALSAVRSRLRIQRALDAAVFCALPALACAAAGSAATKFGFGTLALRHALLAAASALPFAGLVYGASRAVAPLFAARLIDRALGTPDLIGSAWAFLRMPEPEHTPFMRACIGQAARESARLQPAQALAWRRPRALGWLLAGALLVALFARWSPPVAPPKVVAAAPRPRLIAQDDLQAFAQDVHALRLDAQSAADVRDAARELNALLEALADQSLDRSAALRELRGLEQRLQHAALGEDAEALREALRDLGRALAKESAPSDGLAAALAAADAAKARAELEQLAKQLAREPLRADARKRLERALARGARSASADARARADQARAELDRLRKRKQDTPQDEREQRLLRDKQRELDRLERDAAQKERGERQLDALRRELESSGKNLGAGASADAAQHLQRGAQSLERAQREQLSQQQREQLRQQLQQLREQISKQRAAQAGGQGQDQNQGRAGAEQHAAGDAQRLDLERFSRAARGAGANGQPGDGGDGPPGARLLVPGPGGAGEPRMLVPGDGDQPGAQTALRMTESGRASSGGQDGPPPGSRAPTELSGKRIDTRVSGQVGAGPSRSDVIREAGQRGFVAQEYQQVHGEYERHAEDVIERDHVPPGYRFYVRRYFQLIRPREESP